MPAEVLKDERSFRTLLERVGERPELREKLVKTDGRAGNKSGEKKHSKRGFKKIKEAIKNPAEVKQ